MKSMLEAIQVFDLYDEDKYAPEKITNAATYLLQLKEKKIFRSINSVKQAFHQGLWMR